MKNKVQIVKKKFFSNATFTYREKKLKNLGTLEFEATKIQWDTIQK